MWELILAALMRIIQFIQAGFRSCMRSQDHQDEPQPGTIAPHPSPASLSEAHNPPVGYQSASMNPSASGININVVVKQESPPTHRRTHHPHHHNLHLVNGPPKEESHKANLPRNKHEEDYEEYNKKDIAPVHPEEQRYMHSYLRPRHFHDAQTLRNLQEYQHQLALEQEADRLGTRTHQGGPPRRSAFDPV